MGKRREIPTRREKLYYSTGETKRGHNTSTTPSQRHTGKVKEAPAIRDGVPTGFLF